MDKKIIGRNPKEITIKSDEILNYVNLEKFIKDNFRYEATYFYNDPMCIRDSKYCLIALGNDRDLLEQHCIANGFTKSEKCFDGGYEIKDCNPERQIDIEPACIQKINLSCPDSDTMGFTWTDREDPEILQNGITILWVVGRAKAIQGFVESLSYKIGHKCDWSFSRGRAHIDVPKEGFLKACDVISDDNFMEQFIVPYSDESYDNESYFDLKSYHYKVNEIKTSKFIRRQG